MHAFSFMKIHLKIFLQNGGHFVSTQMCKNLRRLELEYGSMKKINWTE